MVRVLYDLTRADVAQKHRRWSIADGVVCAQRDPSFYYKEALKFGVLTLVSKTHSGLMFAPLTALAQQRSALLTGCVKGAFS